MKKVMTYILTVLLLIAAAGMIAYFVLREQGVTFYVEQSGQHYIANSDGGSISLERGKTTYFNVRSLTGGEVNYSVQVISNEANNFGFFVGEQFYRFYDGEFENDDYSEIFSLQKEQDGFSLTIPDDMTAEGAVKQKFGNEVSPQSQILEDRFYFVITVAVDDSTVELWFNFYGLSVSFNSPSIIF